MGTPKTIGSAAIQAAIARLAAAISQRHAKTPALLLLGVANGGIGNMVEVPGTYLLFAEGAPSGPSNGSSIHHVGFLTRSYAQTKASLEDLGADITVDNAETGQILATLPDGVGVELQACDTATVFDDCPSLTGDIAFHHFHASSPDNEAIRQWYLDAFGMDAGEDRKSTRLNSSHMSESRMPSSA